MENFEFLTNLGFSVNEAKVYVTLLRHRVLNGYEIAKLSGVARSLVYDVINRLVAKGAVIKIDGEPNFYKPVEYSALLDRLREDSVRNIDAAREALAGIVSQPAEDDYVVNIVGVEKCIARAKEMISCANAEISLSAWRGAVEVLRGDLAVAIERGVKVYIFTFEDIALPGATIFSYRISDAQTLFPYRRTTLITDGGECLVGEQDGGHGVFINTRNHAIVSLATDEMVLNIFWQKFIESEGLLPAETTGARFMSVIARLAGRLNINENMTKNFMVYNFQRGKENDEKGCGKT